MSKAQEIKFSFTINKELEKMNKKDSTFASYVSFIIFVV